MIAKRWAALIVVLTVAACNGPLSGPDLTGLWVADSISYESGAGEVVDIVARDGASASLIVQRRGDLSRIVSMSFNPGTGSPVSAVGEVDLDAHTFIFEDVTYRFARQGDELILTDPSATFDFGDGTEAATLTIRLTRL